MARSLRSLRQVATLRHVHMARRFAPAFRALGVCEQMGRNLSKRTESVLMLKNGTKSVWDEICVGRNLSKFHVGRNLSKFHVGRNLSLPLVEQLLISSEQGCSVDACWNSAKVDNAMKSKAKTR